MKTKTSQEKLGWVQGSGAQGFKVQGLRGLDPKLHFTSVREDESCASKGGAKSGEPGSPRSWKRGNVQAQACRPKGRETGKSGGAQDKRTPEVQKG